MKSQNIISLILILFLLNACGGPDGAAPEPEPTLRPITFQYFLDGDFQAVVPGWQETLELDSDTLFMAHQDGQFVAINRYPGIPEIVVANFRNHIHENPDLYLVLEEEREGKPFIEYTSREEDQTLRVQAVLDYCQGFTYVVAAGGRDTVDNLGLFQQVLASSSCRDPYLVPELSSGKIGMRVNPAGFDYQEGYYPALRLAKENGVQVVHTYLRWGEVEPSSGKRFWDWQDLRLGYPLHEGFEISLVVNVIHTTVRGPVPEDLESVDFDDPQFIARFTDFILEVLDRYPVQYLSIGNEVNDYFVSHRDQIGAYKTFFLEVKDSIHLHHPEVKVGMTFAYHDAEKLNAVDIIQTLNLGDFLPLTLYIYSPGFKFDRAPAEVEAYLDRILELAGDTPVAFAEIGWNTAEELEGNEEDQAEFVRQVFRLLYTHQDQIAYLSWFTLHDEPLETSYESALTFLPANSPLAQDEAYLTDFVYFLNTLGLLNNDGSHKLGWTAFQEESRIYLDAIQE